jgi:hypothetical protein
VTTKRNCVYWNEMKSSWTMWKQMIDFSHSFLEVIGMEYGLYGCMMMLETTQETLQEDGN